MPGNPSRRSPMRWKKAPEDLITLFTRAMGPVRGAQIRKMFGYPAAFVSGRMFAGLLQAEMFVRLSPKDQQEFMKRPGARPFEPMPGHAMREYAVVPKALLKQPEQLRGWLLKAFVHAKGLPAKAGKGR